MQRISRHNADRRRAIAKDDQRTARRPTTFPQFQAGPLPTITEIDTVAVTSIRVSYNDPLATLTLSAWS
jgi:glutamate 5-kinase